MARKRAELEDLAEGAYVLDVNGTLYEVLDRRTHQEEPEAEPIEQVRIADASDACADEATTAEPKWVSPAVLVGLELVRGPTASPEPRRTVARLR